MTEEVVRLQPATGVPWCRGPGPNPLPVRRSMSGRSALSSHGVPSRWNAAVY
jgi:hypothetical protein